MAQPQEELSRTRNWRRFWESWREALALESKATSQLQMFPQQRQRCEFSRSGQIASLEPLPLMSSLAIALELILVQAMEGQR